MQAFRGSYWNIKTRWGSRLARFGLVLGLGWSLLVSFAWAQAESGRAILPDWQSSLSLVGEWRFQFGDDPRWALPGWDANDWDWLHVGDSWTSRGYPPRGLGWYRLWIELPPFPTQAYSLYVEDIRSAGEIYWDGQHIASIEKYGQSLETEKRLAARPHEITIPSQLLTPGKHLLAVRVSNHLLYANIGLQRLALEPTAKAQRKVFLFVTLYALIFGGIILLIKHHLSIYLGGRHSQEYLMFSGLAILMAAFTATHTGIFSRLTGLYIFPYEINILHFCVYGVPYFMVAFLSEEFDLPLPRARRYFFGVMVAYLLFALAVKGDSFQENRTLLFGFVNLALAILISTGVMVWALRHQKPGSHLIAGGFAAFWLSLILEALNYEQILINPWGVSVAPLGVVVLILAMSATIGQKFSQLNHKITQQVHTLQALNAAGERMARLLDRADVLEVMVETLQERAGVSRCSLYLAKKHHLVLYCTLPEVDRHLPPKTLNFGEGAIGTCIERNHPIYLPDTTQDKFFPLAKPPVTGISLLCLPMKDDDINVGVLALSGVPEALGPESEARLIAETLGRFLTITLKNIELMENTREIARMEAELKTAAAVQHALFPKEHPQPANVELAGYFKSATETGGDWYGYMSYEDCVYIMIGDVTGHGTPAALVTAAARSTCSALQRMHQINSALKLTPAFILEQLNKAVYEVGVQKFLMTFFVARLDLHTGELSFANAGHNYPLLFHEGRLSSIIAKGGHLGWSLESDFQTQEMQLYPGDLVVFYTDGLIENLNGDEKMFGMKGLRQFMRRHAEFSAQDFADHLERNVFEFLHGHPLEDDMTFVVLKIVAPFPAQLSEEGMV